MAYWGYKTPANFGVWLAVVVFLVTGAIWLIVGGVGAAGCGYCYKQYKDLPNNADLDNLASYDLNDGCNIALYSFALLEPVHAASDDSEKEFYAWCVGTTGPFVEMIAGGVIFLVGLLLLTYFCCAPRPSNDSANKVAPA